MVLQHFLDLLQSSRPWALWRPGKKSTDHFHGMCWRFHRPARRIQYHSSQTIRGAAQLEEPISEETARSKRAAGKVEPVLHSEIKLRDIPYYSSRRLPLAIKLPPGLATGAYHLSGAILSGDRVLSRNETALFIAGKDW